MPLQHSRRATLLALAAACAILAAGGCGKAVKEARLTITRTDAIEDTGRFTPEEVGDHYDINPWISHVCIVDLDQDGLPDILACDDHLNAIVWLRQ